MSTNDDDVKRSKKLDDVIGADGPPYQPSLPTVEHARSNAQLEGTLAIRSIGPLWTLSYLRPESDVLIRVDESTLVKGQVLTTLSRLRGVREEPAMLTILDGSTRR
jgi:hypothetical protein